mgnify:FL=1
MNKAKYSDRVVKLATVPQAMERYKLGRNSIMELAKNNEAIRRFGRSVRIDVEVLDKAIEQY